MTICKQESLRLELNERGYLRILYESDVTKAYVNGLNDPEVNRFLVGPRRQRQTFASVQQFVRMNREATDAVLLGLYVDEVLRGTIRLYNITTDEISLGLALFDKSVWGQGWGRIMISAASQYALDKWAVKKVKAFVEVDNIASQNAFRAAGYKYITSMHHAAENVFIQAWEYVAKLI